jgi:hypothetical protein
MQHLCAHPWNPRGRSWTRPGSFLTSGPAPHHIAPREVFSHEGHDSFPTWIGKTSESRSIKLNQGQSKWIKPLNIVFENKAAERPQGVEPSSSRASAFLLLNFKNCACSDILACVKRV